MGLFYGKSMSKSRTKCEEIVKIKMAEKNAYTNVLFSRAGAFGWREGGFTVHRASAHVAYTYILPNQVVESKNLGIKIW